MAEYKLSASLVRHGEDVRALLFPSPKTIYSAGRDCTVLSWHLLSDNPPIFDATLFTESSKWISSLAYLPPNNQFPEGLIFSGGSDHVIEARQPSKTAEDNAEALLLGHGDNVVALAVDPAGKYIVSGSWDHTARIWPVRKWESSGVLREHGKSVWAVLPYDSDTLITGCADGHIRIYTTNGLSGKFMKLIPGVDYRPVRGLCRLENHPSGADFASASGEADVGFIRLWKLSGELVDELRGHNSYVYALATSKSGEIFSVGEDKTLKVWRGSECVQTITHPTSSVWSVAVCQETGDVVTGASDSIVRVFTREPSRTADAETIQQFDASVREHLKPKPSVRYYSEQPGLEALTKRIKTKEGEVIHILELEPEYVLKAYKRTASGWDEVPPEGDFENDLPKEKTKYAGKEYDYVLPIGFDFGGSNVHESKIPFNFGDSLPDVAEKFLERIGLGRNSPGFDFNLDVVQNRIRKSVDAVGRRQERIDKEITEEKENKEKKEKKENKENTRAEIEAAINANEPSTSRQTPSPPKPKLLPQKEYLSIVNADVSKFKEQLTKTNKSLIDNGKKDISLNSKEILVIFACCKEISDSKLSKNYKNTRGTLDICVKILTQWPYSDRGAALGIISLLARQAETGSYTHEEQDIITILVNSCKDSTPAKDSYVTWTTRAIANLFGSPAGFSAGKADFHFLKYQELITSSLNNGNKATSFLGAVATLYTNLGVAFHDASAKGAIPDSEIVYEVFTTLPKIITTDPGVAERGLVALGTFLDIGVGVKKLAGELKLEDTVNEVVKKYGEKLEINLLGGELKELLVIENEDTVMEG